MRGDRESCVEPEASFTEQARISEQSERADREDLEIDSHRALQRPTAKSACRGARQRVLLSSDGTSRGMTSDFLDLLVNRCTTSAAAADEVQHADLC